MVEDAGQEERRNLLGESGIELLRPNLDDIVKNYFMRSA